MKTLDYYTLTGVSASSNPAEIKKAYHQFCKAYHPDIRPHTTEQQKEWFLARKQAFETLMDPVLRRKYDLDRFEWKRQEQRRAYKNQQHRRERAAYSTGRPAPRDAAKTPETSGSSLAATAWTIAGSVLVGIGVVGIAIGMMLAGEDEKPSRRR